MVFRRFRKGARKAGRYVRRWAKKRYGTPGGIGRLVKDVQMLKTAVNSERKYYDRVDTADAIKSSAPYAHHAFDGLQMGNSEITRTGDQIKALYTTYRLHIENITDPTAEAGNPAGNRIMVRVIAFLDTSSRYESATAAATIQTHILEKTADARQLMLSPYKVSHTIGAGSVGDRYKILRDKVFTLDLEDKTQRMIKMNFSWTRNRYKGMRIKYEEVSGGSVAQPDPRMYFMILTDCNLANTVLRTHLYSRTCFVDN